MFLYKKKEDARIRKQYSNSYLSTMVCWTIRNLQYLTERIGLWDDNNMLIKPLVVYNV